MSKPAKMFVCMMILLTFLVVTLLYLFLPRATAQEKQEQTTPAQTSEEKRIQAHNDLVVIVTDEDLQKPGFKSFIDDLVKKLAEHQECKGEVKIAYTWKSKSSDSTVMLYYMYEVTVWRLVVEKTDSGFEKRSFDNPKVARFSSAALPSLKPEEIQQQVLNFILKHTASSPPSVQSTNHD
jgi:hypothetical protein